jgi:2'-5' RNA ligase
VTTRVGTTIGVAIAVPEPWGGQLQQYRTALGDSTAAGIPTHVTLMPPFETDDLPAIERHLAEASAGTCPFRIHLRGTGTFRPVSPVVFVTVAEGISACEQLAKAVRRGPLDTDLTFHELAGFDCRFVVDRFSLYVHDPEDGWVPTRDFPLAGEGRLGA